MGIPRFFSTPKPKQFNYIPRYYDEQKEALEERIRDIEIEMGVKNLYEAILNETSYTELR